jgi:SAM-dependent methyltransferase
MSNDLVSARKLARIYDEKFYADQSKSSYVSALNVWPTIFEMLPLPRSILDVGSGVGAWLRAARDLRPTIEVTGIDHPGIEPTTLLIPSEHFIGHDLAKSFDLKKRFDLAMSLEVAEHLPDTVADTFVGNLVRHSSTVLFSAAAPGQGGTSHVNEQWPRYWIGKFESHGYRCYDIVRPMIWDNQNVQFWYRQNIFLFSEHPHFVPPLPTRPDWSGHSLIHPACMEGGLGVKASARLLVRSLLRRFGSRS